MQRDKEFDFEIAKRVFPDLGKETLVVNINDQNFAFAELYNYEIVHRKKTTEGNFTFSFIQ